MEEGLDPGPAADKAMEYAIELNNKFKKYFDDVSGEEIGQAKEEAAEERIIPELRDEFRPTGS